MPDVECTKCGTSFDPDRDPEHYGSGERCPYCGTPAALEDDRDDEPDGGAHEIVAPAGATVRISIEIEPAE